MGSGGGGARRLGATNEGKNWVISVAGAVGVGVGVVVLEPHFIDSCSSLVRMRKTGSKR